VSPTPSAILSRVQVGVGRRARIRLQALREYVARHAPDEVTDALDRVVESVGSSIDPFVEEAGTRILDSTEW